MSALGAAVESLCAAAELDQAEVTFVRVDNRRGTVQFVTPRGSLRFEIEPPKPAKKAPAKKATAKRPAKKTAAKKATKRT